MTDATLNAVADLLRKEICEGPRPSHITVEYPGAIQTGDLAQISRAKATTLEPSRTLSIGPSIFNKGTDYEYKSFRAGLHR